MSKAVEKAKEIATTVEEKVEKGVAKAAEVLDNVVSHLPFANLAKKSDGTFRVEIDMPGVKKEDISITVDGNILSVSGIRKYKNEVSADDYYLHECSYGKIERKFVIPDGIDRDKISAELHDGQLVIELEKEEKLKPKSISVK